ncbi:hypothetical protein TWF718_006107 [Orbilia javanica]|uniref:Uncharacterized protein n=1 Tax=Orbilia javanica TaxID=47235 RepID=A0AAN8MQS5_9PEZI
MLTCSEVTFVIHVEYTQKVNLIKISVPLPPIFNIPYHEHHFLLSLSFDLHVGGKIGHGMIVFIGVPHGPHSFPDVVVLVGGAIGHGTRVIIGVPHGPQSVAGPVLPGHMGVGRVVHVVQAVVVFGGKIGQGTRVLIGVPHGPHKIFGPKPPGQRGVGKVVQVMQVVVVVAVGDGRGQGGWAIGVPHGPHRIEAGNPGQIGVENVEQVVQGS